MAAAGHGPVSTYIRSSLVLPDNGEPSDIGRAIFDALDDVNNFPVFIRNPAPRKRLRITAESDDHRTHELLAFTPFELLVDSNTEGANFLAPTTQFSIVRETAAPAKEPWPAVQDPRPSGRARMQILVSRDDVIDFATDAISVATDFGWADIKTVTWDGWEPKADGPLDVLQIWCHGEPGALQIVGANGSRPDLDEVLDRIV